ncbi:MAG: acyl carrier protein [Fervidobacterium sp.]
MSKEKVVLEAINKILEKKGKNPLSELDTNISLRNDLEFDSLDLAELTVRIENETGIDIFEKGIIDKISEVLERLGENG